MQAPASAAHQQLDQRSKLLEEKQMIDLALSARHFYQKETGAKKSDFRDS
ncbi:hypothetical protein Sez_0181 [Streptococcus equi subsp. zooepidemicus MGCS10565]|uniref:Uncharacterized protein n=2 Tax=Streptococcus equi TaxID=1336 RepID=B4U0B4_STREM|nr:hypothetical protein Sez_0179 [Streptococcus equi subsp. zooepidemicus MGCS10565]ACG61559.1 hypothetical protein Sez_0181 [Streptococcus equi subsp. zooepidemicus MGCS10565]